MLIEAISSLSAAQVAEEWKRVALDVPQALVDETLRRGKEMVPYLGPMITDDALWSAEGSEGWAPIHAIFLLCAIGGAEIAPFAAEFLRKGYGGDWLTEEGRYLVFSIGSGNLEPIWGVVEDRDAYEWGRCGAVEGIALVALAEESCRADLTHRLRDFLVHLLEIPKDQLRKEEYSLASNVCLCLGQLHDESSRELIQSAYKNHRCDAWLANLEDVEWEFSEPFEKSLRHRNPSDHFRPEELKRLGKISEHIHTDHPSDDVPPDEEEDLYPASEPYVRTEPKIGRNDPCLCGSGKKYKKCCWDR